jgi:hypothetical protein
VDRQGKKKLGRTQHRDSTRQGLKVMNALAMDETGAPLGLLGQRWWRRADEYSPPWHRDSRPAHERESILWELVLDECIAGLSQHASDVRPWFQLDRGADSNRVLRWAHLHREQADVTFRNAYERTADGKPLRKMLVRRVPAGRLDVPIRASRGLGRQRPARLARCDVRFAQVVIQPKRHSEGIPASVVHVRETRRHAQRLEWWLITTRAVRHLAEAVEVVAAYTRRWRVEEFHYAWKTGACNVESSQLRTTHALRVWATVLSAVAARVERLKQLSRTQPDLPALDELTVHEVDAAIVLSQSKHHRPGDELTIGQAVRLIAMVGGHAGRPSAGPPGSKVLARGLERILYAAQMAEELRKSD